METGFAYLGDNDRVVDGFVVVVLATKWQIPERLSAREMMRTTTRTSCYIGCALVVFTAHAVAAATQVCMLR